MMRLLLTLGPEQNTEPGDCLKPLSKSYKDRLRCFASKQSSDRGFY